MTTAIPILLLERDGYSIERVLVGLKVAWILLFKDQYGHVSKIADGWSWSFSKAARNSYDAFLAHSADEHARVSIRRNAGSES